MKAICIRIHSTEDRPVDHQHFEVVASFYPVHGVVTVQDADLCEGLTVQDVIANENGYSVRIRP
jgi:hypothetical protein